MSELTEGATVSAAPGTGFGIAGKIAPITGAASGIGRETVELLARCGAVVAGIDIDAKGLVSPDLGNSGSTDVADLSVPEACERVVKAALKRCSRIEIPPNVAAVLRPTNVELRSQYVLCRAAGAAMKPRR